ncbi:MAG: hypothetical protein K2I89_04760 [Muribaculaceae bacterium]|nr:hypothetical protein [Muribaculaceae bacterium]
MKNYDEKEAIAFIKSATNCVSLTDDDILNIIDAIFDYYDENGELEVDFDEDSDDDEVNPEDIAAYLTEEFPELDEGLAERIVRAEIGYENSLL